MTLREWLEKREKEYDSIAYDFPTYSPKFELYYGHSLAFKKMLDKLSDETLNQTVSFKR